MIDDKEKVKTYYDQEAHRYLDMYKESYKSYPANKIRLEIIANLLKKNNVKTVLDAGCGTSGTVLRFLKDGFDVRGFDFSKEMVDQGKKELKDAGYDPTIIFQADIEDETTLPNQKFDAIIASGVFPHILNEEKALTNIYNLLNKGGIALIEFRNDLFAAFTLNRYSLNFFLNKVLNIKSLPENIQNELSEFYSQRMNADKQFNKEEGKLHYTDILAKFHNPLNISKSLFEPCHFSVRNLHFYHFHALPPFFESKYPQLFREISLKMENPNDWKGYLMASAFVVEAVRND